MTTFETDSTQNEARIRRAGAMLRHFCAVMIVTIPVGAAAYWALVTEESQWLPYVVGDLTVALTPTSRAAAFLVTLVPGAVLMWAFWTLRRLFSLYSAGQYFSRDTVRCFRHLGLAALVWMISNLVHGALLSLSLTMANPPGERAVAVSGTGVDLTALFAGLVLLVLSWVMDEARRLDEDQSQIV